MNNDQENNRVTLCGAVTSLPSFSHELFDEKFFEFFVDVPRLSQHNDNLPVTVSDRLMADCPLAIGQTVVVNGQFRSYNKVLDGRSRLMLTVFARDLVLADADAPLAQDCAHASTNIIELSGYICKPPIYRTTPFNREICDILLAVNRAYNKSDYIPCIAWGRNARFVRGIEVGQRINITGRIQSREYTKKISEAQSVVKVAYEVSVAKIQVPDCV